MSAGAADIAFTQHLQAAQTGASRADAASGLNRRDWAYLTAYAGVLLLCWSPFKWAAYAAPALAIVWVVLAGRSGAVLARTLVLALAAALVVAAHLAWNEVFVLSSALVAMVTYSSLAVIWVFPARHFLKPELLSRMTDLTRNVVLLEAGFGIVQAVYGYWTSGSFDGANGDLVQGTIFPHFYGDGAFANPMYGAGLTLMVLALVPLARWKRGYALAVVLGTVALVMASVVHQLIFLAAAVALAYLWVRPRLPFSRAAVPLVAVGLVTPALVFLLLPGNLTTLSDIVRQFREGSSPRRLILERVAEAMPDSYPYMPVVGVGPGQFSSRAALINTGYFAGSPRAPKDYGPLIRNAIPAPMREFLFELWIANANYRYYGSSQKPFFGWLSVYTEFGALGVTAAVAAIVVALARLPRRSKNIPLGLLSFSVAGMIFFIALLALQENYWEVPQAVLPGLFLIKAMHARARWVHRAARG